MQELEDESERIDSRLSDLSGMIWVFRFIFVPSMDEAGFSLRGTRSRDHVTCSKNTLQKMGVLEERSRL
jgi:hypothetical protein